MSLNFKDYFFATCKIPVRIDSDFKVYTKIPWGDIFVKIYVPGKDSLVVLAITSEVAIRNHSILNKEVATLTYESPSKIDLSVRGYQWLDYDLFGDIVNLNNPEKTNRILAKKQNKDISLHDFICLCENAFLTKLKNTLNNNYRLVNASNEPIHTHLDIDILEKLEKTFIKSFNKLKKIIDPELSTTNYSKLFSNPLLISNFNEVISEFELTKLRFDLDNNLKENKSSNRPPKI